MFMLAPGFSSFMPSLARLVPFGATRDLFGEAVIGTGARLARFVPTTILPLLWGTPVSAARTTAKPRLAILRTADLVERIVDKSGFPITALSDALDLERKTIYDWRKGAEAQTANFDRLRVLDAIFAEEAPGSLRAFHRLWKRELPDGTTLRELLTAQSIDEKRLKAALEILRPAAMASMASDRSRRTVSWTGANPPEALSGYLEVGSRE